MDAGTKFEANKAFSLGGRAYSPGDAIDIEQMSNFKMVQLLKQRFLRPVGVSIKDVTGR